MERWACAIALSLIASLASAQNVKIVAGTGPSGKAMQTPDGKELYVYDGDEVNRNGGGKSSCNKQCATEWPPFAAPAGAKPHGHWSIVRRSDGSRQWAYDGRPLYTYAKASTPAPNAGNGANGNKWHLATP